MSLFTVKVCGMSRSPVIQAVLPFLRAGSMSSGKMPLAPWPT
jgi:hypothetical protein